ncbi:COX assembly mitochondrial protein homolog [Puntigrus tetrazona]|uniref:COX assembly mitochondrial protein homolog n=1 Tax=Puntigrus tetrazona TaxID=1606681 RepID=UPI001C88FF64|nr:COX assembly mitochondrial protein homolog [Puntigrus tetrazona]
MDPSKAEEPELRHVEKDVLIPKLMREKAKERCSEHVHEFNRCCKDTGFLMVFKCQEENAALKQCLTQHYQDPAFFDECKREYLREKVEYQQTGIPAKNRQQKIPSSM